VHVVDQIRGVRALPAADDRLRRMAHLLVDRTHCRLDCRSTDILLLWFGSLNRPRIEHALYEVTRRSGYVDAIFHEEEPAEECGETREDEQIETTHGSEDATVVIRSRVNGDVASLHMRDDEQMDDECRCTDQHSSICSGQRGVTRRPTQLKLTSKSGYFASSSAFRRSKADRNCGGRFNCEPLLAGC
jgi:hypothetical protein